MALFSGWVFLIRPDESGEGKSSLLPRYMVLADHSIITYRHDPAVYPDEKPLSTSPLGLTVTVEDCGRETIEGRSFYVLHMFNKALPGQGGKIATVNASAAQQWISAIQLVIDNKDVKGNQRGDGGVQSRDVSFPQMICIGPGASQALQQDKSAAAEIGGDAVEDTQWRIFKVTEGIRIFHEASDDPNHMRLVKAEVVVEATADDVFEVFMGGSLSERLQWDVMFVNGEVVEVIDGHTDIVYAVMTNRQHTLKRPVEKDVLMLRTWRRAHDGSYAITTSPTAHPKHPPSAKYPRFELSLGSTDIIPLTPPSLPSSFYIRPRCLIRHIIELVAHPLLPPASPVSSHSPSSSPSPSHPPHHSHSKINPLTQIRSGVSTVFSLFPRPSVSTVGPPPSKSTAWGEGGKEGGKEGGGEAHTSTPNPLLRLVSMTSRVTGGGGQEEGGSVPFEELEDSFVYAGLMRFAALREYFASQPVTLPAAVAAVAAASSVSSDMTAAAAAASLARTVSNRTTSGSITASRLPKKAESALVTTMDSVNEEFFDALPDAGPDSDLAKKVGSARARWLQIKWAVRFGHRIRSLFDEDEALAEEGESWEIRKELQTDVPPVPVDDIFPSLRQLASLTEGATAGSENAWANPGGDNFFVRGPNYLQDGLKIPASAPLLHLVAVDWFHSDERIDNVAARPGSLMQSEAGKKLPFVFVLNLQVPGSPQYSLVCYFASDRPLREGSLLQRFADAKDDAYRNKRFKLIPRIEEGFWVVKRAVGTKAAILGKAVACSYHRGPNYLEMDVDVGSTAVARNVIGLVISYVKALVVDLAILIEAQEQEDLPEYLLGTVTLVRIEPKLAVAPPPAN